MKEKTSRTSLSFGDSWSKYPSYACFAYLPLPSIVWYVIILVMSCCEMTYSKWVRHPPWQPVLVQHCSCFSCSLLSVVLHVLLGSDANTNLAYAHGAKDTIAAPRIDVHDFSFDSVYLENENRPASLPKEATRPHDFFKHFFQRLAGSRGTLFITAVAATTPNYYLNECCSVYMW